MSGVHGLKIRNISDVMYNVILSQLIHSNNHL